MSITPSSRTSLYTAVHFTLIHFKLLLIKEEEVSIKALSLMGGGGRRRLGGESRRIP